MLRPASTLRHSREHARYARILAIARAMRTAATQAYPHLHPDDVVWGRYAKRHYYDCGHARCPICHPSKIGARYATLQERRQQMRTLD